MMVGDTHHTGERTKMYLIFFKFKGIFVITQAANIHFMVWLKHYKKRPPFIKVVGELINHPYELTLLVFKVKDSCCIH